MTSIPYDKYKKFQKELIQLRIFNHNIESIEEDDILDKMDGMWSLMSIEEQYKISVEFDI